MFKYVEVRSQDHFQTSRISIDPVIAIWLHAWTDGVLFWTLGCRVRQGTSRTGSQQMSLVHCQGTTSRLLQRCLTSQTSPSLPQTPMPGLLSFCEYFLSGIYRLACALRVLDSSRASMAVLSWHMAKCGGYTVRQDTCPILLLTQITALWGCATALLVKDALMVPSYSCTRLLNCRQ